MTPNVYCAEIHLVSPLYIQECLPLGNKPVNPAALRLSCVRVTCRHEARIRVTKMGLYLVCWLKCGRRLDFEGVWIMEFTGERYIPGQGGAQIAYEHWHRYLYALRWAHGRNVIDVASGTGYGAGLLASVAKNVMALDQDEESIAYARSKYNSPNLLFVRANASSLPVPPNSVDLVAAFEILEHMTDPERLVFETARAIRPGGVVVISTPDKAAYSDARSYVNSFHAREFYQDELKALLYSYFRQVTIVSQRMRAGSMISAGPYVQSKAEVFARALPECDGEPLADMYFLAICSTDERTADYPEASVYLDLTDMLFREADLKLNQSMAGYNKLREKARGLAAEKEEHEQQIEQLKADLYSREQELARIKEEFRRELELREKTIQILREKGNATGGWTNTQSE